MESITIKRTSNGVWMKKFDTFETKFTRISKAEAMECIENARRKGDLFFEQNDQYGALYGYWN